MKCNLATQQSRHSKTNSIPTFMGMVLLVQNKIQTPSLKMTCYFIYKNYSKTRIKKEK
jgi:hypothetical protein